MLDLKFVIANLDKVRENIENRFLPESIDLNRLEELYREQLALKRNLDELRQQRKQNAAAVQRELGESERRELGLRGKELKQQILEREGEYSKLESELSELLLLIPNMAHPEAPIGQTDQESRELRQVGSIPDFSFEPKGHLELMEALDLIDFENAARVSGAKFYYLKNEAALLELALTRFAFDMLRKHGFSIAITPDVARESVLSGIGFQPRGEESATYFLEGEDLCLIATAEITLGGLHSGKILDLSRGPIGLGGISHCFRKEAGAAGQYSKGLYRVHQFTKTEMFIFCRPEDSEREHSRLLAIEEEIFQALEIPYRVLDVCTGDLGAPAHRKFDLEAWMPGRGESGDWGEVTSTSNCLDYQARRLGIRYRGAEPRAGEKKPPLEYVHMLNGTAIAVSRAIIALVENHQNQDGSIRIPERLQPYMGISTIGKNDRDQENGFS